MASPIEVEFTGTEVPHAVYRLYDAEDRLLYVGFTWNIPARMELHAADKSWWPEVARRTMVWYGSEREARKAEAMAIETEDPLHNKMVPTTDGGATPNRRRDGYHTKPVFAWRPPPELAVWARSEAQRRGQPIGEFLTGLLVAEQERVTSAPTYQEWVTK